MIVRWSIGRGCVISFVIAIDSRVWRPREGLHNFLQDGPIRFQFEPLAGIPRGILAYAAISVACFAYNKETYRSQKAKDNQANDNRDSYVEAAFVSCRPRRQSTRRGVKIITWPISGNVAPNELTVRSVEIFGAIAVPLRFGCISRQYAGSMVCAKPIRGCFLLQLTISFGFVFAKQSSKVPATCSAIAIILSLVGRILCATRAVLTVMTVRASSDQGWHDLLR